MFVRKLPKRRVLLVAILATAASCSAIALLNREPARDVRQPTASPASITVNMMSPISVAFDRSVAATGTVAPRDELIVGSDASGVRLTEVLVDVGSVVRKGELLARADDKELQAQLAQQEALIAQAQVEYEQARANLERAEALKDSGVYSVETVQTRRTNAAAANAKVALALAQRRELEVKIGHAKVMAPASGVVSHRSATVGAVIQPGTELFRLIRDGQLEWRAELPSHSLARVQPGDEVRITDGDRIVEARVRMIAPTIDVNTRNGLLYVTLPAGAPFRSGGHARGEVLIDSTQAMAIPESSILTRDGYSYVYVVDSSGVARLTRIETGVRQRGQVEITAGLPAEARVVSTGAGFVKNGELVRIAPGTSTQVAQTGEKS
jgi:RND family efflux transporter MFP subunit